MGKKKVSLLKNVSGEFPSHTHTAVLFHPGLARTSLIKIINGVIAPDSGYCQVRGLVSWPVSWHGLFTPNLTSVENISFITRLYGYRPSETLAFVKEFSGLREELKFKFSDLEGENKFKIFFLTTLAIPFDYYIFEGDLGVGPPAFKKTCEQLITARMETSSVVFFTHKPALAARFKNLYVKDKHGLRYFNNSEQAGEYFKIAHKI